ncbi:hypothetical protein P3S67_023152 [Capsicum chacoense]
MESSRKRLGLIKGKLVKSLYRAAAAAAPPKPSPATNQYGSSNSSSRVPNQLNRPSIIHHLNHHEHQQPKQKLAPYNPNSTTASSLSSSSTATVDFILNQDQVSIPQKPKISFYIPPVAENTTDQQEYSNSTKSSGTTSTTYNYAKMLDNECVDLKAANYISSVQERFKLERINSERKAHYFSHSNEEVLQLHQ